MTNPNRGDSVDRRPEIEYSLSLIIIPCRFGGGDSSRLRGRMVSGNPESIDA